MNLRQAIFRILRKLVTSAKTSFAPRADIGNGKIVFNSTRVKLCLIKKRNSRLILNGNLILQSDLGDTGRVCITLNQNSTLEVNGDFIVGPGVHLMICENAVLKIEGKRNSSGSGITCNTRIMVNKSLHIGSDTIVAWDCFITDCDWHQIEGVGNTAETFIGERVWIGRGVTVLKGASIPNGCIVGAGAVITSKLQAEANSLVAGSPAKIVRRDVSWHR